MERRVFSVCVLLVVTTALFGITSGAPVTIDIVKIHYGSTSRFHGEPQMDVITNFTGNPPHGTPLDAKLLVSEVMTGRYSGGSGISKFSQATTEILSPDHMRRDLIDVYFLGLGPARMNITQIVTNFTKAFSKITFQISGALSGKYWMKFTLNSTNSVIVEQAWNTASDDVVKSIGIPFSSSFIAMVHAKGAVSTFEFLAMRVNKMRQK